MSKYRAVRTQYAGEWYDSAKEARYAAMLEMCRFALHPSDKVVKIERQPVFDLKVCKYKADFRVTYADGRVEIVDVKGYETPVFKLKKKLMAELYPDIKLKVI